MSEEVRKQIESDASIYCIDNTAEDPPYVKKHHYINGAVSQDPIAFRRGIEHMAKVVISGIDARELDAHGRIPATTVKAVIQRELEKLKL